MAKKLLKKLKKVAKVAVPVLGALALAKGLGKRRLSKARIRPCNHWIGLLEACPGKIPHLGPYVLHEAKPHPT